MLTVTENVWDVLAKDINFEYTPSTSFSILAHVPYGNRDFLVFVYIKAVMIHIFTAIGHRIHLIGHEPPD